MAGDLYAADVPFLLPMIREEKHRPTGKKQRYVTDTAMFSGYLFVAGDDFDYLNARASRRVITLIPVVDKVQLIRDLSNLMAAIESGAPLGKSRTPLPGDTVRVTSGPLEDRVGTLVRDSHRGDVLHLHVHCLGRVLECAVEAWRCEVIEPGIDQEGHAPR